MRHESPHRAIAVLAVAMTGSVCAQSSSAWQDPSPHRVRFVTVSPGVLLETLDWGGSGRPIVLLAGSGNTAHVFDDFAPRLASVGHVYGITRRGFGASSQPASGYGDQQLADDVLAVLDSMNLETPVLLGHSMAGGEMTTLASRHPNRLGGLVYLDALADPVDGTWNDPAYMALLEKLPAGKRQAPVLDYTSFAAYRAAQTKNFQYAFPEAELRAGFTGGPSGTMGSFKTPPSVFTAIGQGQTRRDYSRIRVPVLALMEFPRRGYDAKLDAYQARDADERAAIEAVNRATASYIERWMQNLTAAVPKADLVNLPGAGHFVFITRESEVVEAVRAFVAGL